ncbi:MAG: type I DNA topoisomerase [Candidatus Omnitrophica bacterium]|nr:type I DNA topoisomerase [Candidatus Omnitrophota bacterium]
MVKPVVIVESPTKVKTINKMLGGKYKVLSSMGHLVDLPKSTLGVDLEHEFEPKLIVVRSKQKILTKLKKDTLKSKKIFFATDPDREGEAIGWNLKEHIGKDKEIYRVTFQEITKDAVRKAFENPREFDIQRINAQITRRILDRIVGYKISPLLWRKVGSRLSAGRVQSVALHIIVDRERQIQAFIPKEYWQIAVDLKKEDYPEIVESSLDRIDGEKFELSNEPDTKRITDELKDLTYTVSKISKKQIKRKSRPPVITSTMQQEAFNKLRFNASKTMMLAQQLYEGIEVVDGDPVGLITYMRTDSVNVSKEAIEKVRGFILESYGEKYLPEVPNKFKSKKSAQEAHEAIRPTDVLRKPQHVRAYLDRDQYNLYEIIWNRFVSSQMTPSVSENRRMEIMAGKYLFSASGSTLVFDGFLTLDLESKEEDKTLDFSHYQKDDDLKMIEIKPTQHFTKPPPRFSEASLVKALEEDGIGRPSTYASIIQTLVMRNYVVRDRGYFHATELGCKICDLLVEYFPKIMDVGFTAQMEENLDLIEEGKISRNVLLKEFYIPFKEELEYADANIVKTQNFVDKKCPECDRQMVIKWGRRGKFLSCSGFPECKYAQPYTLGIKCPQEECDGELVKRRSRSGAAFYGCSRYPKCSFVTNTLPDEDSSKEKTSA